ncbi:MAG: DUF3014 domain-containing protein [Rhodoferax sp.]|uniref:DUF3014 domain-containing protein n=1 Tax=Rhodoferax sp. TaxID=50421 RepID=UPI0013FF8719|nr:DUF3014 domain-containing protein [Rhodoferax sp.]NDP38665.1 DUF3014 domain-containing protein [Rhodoferax sp.]
MSTARRTLLAVVICAVIIGAAVLWWNMSRPAPQAPVAAAPAPEPAALAVPESAAAPAEPVIQYPVEAPPAQALPLKAADMGTVLTELLGRKAVLEFFALDEFPRRLVATVDNLGRSHAPPMLWPIKPTPGRFMVEERADGSVINADNSQRYTPLVLLAESVDAGKAVDLYIRMYPLLQQAYEELGYPKAYFNDRLIAVIDQLLATPAAVEPIEVQLTEVKGSIPSLQPWVRYEFANPAFESLSAGQKIMLRVGSVNERRLKAKLTAIRQQLIKRVAPR